MAQYVLDHHLEGEKKRLGLMSQLLDPMHRRYIESLGISRGARVLEVGCGNGSMSAWMAKHVVPDGQVVGLDLDLSSMMCIVRALNSARVTSSRDRLIPAVSIS